MSNKTCFVIYSSTSRNSTAGLRPNVMWTFKESIIEAASRELMGEGWTFEDMAGVPWIEYEDDSFRPARELSDEEILALSIEKLGDDERLYITFETDEAGAAEFIETADRYGLGDEARAVVDHYNS